MMKKINIAGIELDNYTVRESGLKISKMISEKPFVVVQEVDMDTVMLAGEDDKVKAVIEDSDMTIITEAEILEVAGESLVTNIQRKHEIYTHYQINDMLRKTERKNKTVFILGETAAQVEQVREFLEQKYTELKIVGQSDLESCIGEYESVVNEINSAAANMVLAVLTSPMREHFLFENRDKISADLWYGVSGNGLNANKKGIRQLINRYIKVRRLAKHINDYEEKEVDN